ncbi:hypothetical protein Gotri_004562 [Gossypium trilobum]|uniref:CCHC-type domain-containing protein n=1 Tax=Gossypium trilobum TaxID=34281 RepID=A0A7J9F5N0_9ROSI|nr:hypothetical protein [Gossypium trilobum]
MQNSGNNGDGDPHPNGDRNTKQVRFKESLVEEGYSMAVDPDPPPNLLWNDKLLGGVAVVSDLNHFGPSMGIENKFELLEGNVNTSMIDGIQAIAFLDRRNIDYNAINNLILNLWKPAKSIHLMDIANGYFLVKFQAFEDYNKALTQGPWIFYGQYLTVQPLTKDFSPSQPYPSVVMIDGAIQRVEYEVLSTVCFACGKYGHVKKLCPLVGDKAQEKAEIAVVTFTSGAVGEGESAKRPEFGLWMLVERNSRRGQWVPLINGAVKSGNYPLGSRFSALIEEEEPTGDLKHTVGENSEERNKEMVTEGRGSKVDFGPAMGPDKGSFLGSIGADVLGRTSKDLMENSMGPKNKRGCTRDSSNRGNHKTSFALRGLGSRFKSSGNSRIPLAESMEVMVELLSPQGPSKTMNVELDDAGLSMGGDTGCASVKFPRIFREQNLEYKPDIVSLLKPKVSRAKADVIIANLGFQFSHRVEATGYSGGIWLG